ncbi:WXG100 family type VII secretion target [Kitasatospora sp. NPDC093102]|uniref:WXG100 family type VII secretion target n=1 Tax=Kitasatospora sp. NPDC093102 TaxID=3155069 RepID=UPI0034463D75
MAPQQSTQAVNADAIDHIVDALQKAFQVGEGHFGTLQNSQRILEAAWQSNAAEAFFEQKVASFNRAFTNVLTDYQQLIGLLKQTATQYRAAEAKANSIVGSA